MQHYDVSELKKAAEDFGARILWIIGQRSNGKTYQVVKEILTGFEERSETGLYVRRWRDDLKTENIADLFAKHDPSVTYRNHRYTKNGITVCRTTSLAQSEHFKGTVIPNDCKTILFDEMFAEGRELPSEFAKWQSVLSTAVRDRDDVTVYMVGNTVRRTSTYFSSYRIDPKRLKKGEINLVTVKDGKNEIKIAIEWCEKNEYVTRNHNAYFVNISAQNMLMDGDFESSPHHTCTFQKASIGRWNNARKFPICFHHEGIFYEMRADRCVLLVKRGNKALYVYDPSGFHPSNNKQFWFDIFPFYTPRNEIREMQNFISSSITQNSFICDSIETGEIVQEMIGAKIKK